MSKDPKDIGLDLEKTFKKLARAEYSHVFTKVKPASYVPRTVVSRTIGPSALNKAPMGTITGTEVDVVLGHSADDLWSIELKRKTTSGFQKHQKIQYPILNDNGGEVFKSKTNKLGQTLKARTPLPAHRVIIITASDVVEIQAGRLTIAALIERRAGYLDDGLDAALEKVAQEVKEQIARRKAIGMRRSGARARARARAKASARAKARAHAAEQRGIDSRTKPSTNPDLNTNAKARLSTASRLGRLANSTRVRAVLGTARFIGRVAIQSVIVEAVLRFYAYLERKIREKVAEAVANRVSYEMEKGWKANRKLIEARPEFQFFYVAKYSVTFPTNRVSNYRANNSTESIEVDYSKTPNVFLDGSFIRAGPVLQRGSTDPGEFTINEVEDGDFNVNLVQPMLVFTDGYPTWGESAWMAAEGEGPEKLIGSHRASTTEVLNDFWDYMGYAKQFRPKLYRQAVKLYGGNLEKLDVTALTADPSQNQHGLPTGSEKIDFHQQDVANWSQKYGSE